MRLALTLSARAQLAIAALMIGAAGVALWFIVKREPVEVGLLPPKLLGFTATAPDGGTPRTLGPDDRVNAGELIDFQIEVQNRCFVYVFLVAGPRAELDWGPGRGDPAWEPGVYAPDWAEGGLKFDYAGKVRIVAVASWTPLADAVTWNTLRIDALGAHCPKCRKTEVTLEIAGPAPPSPSLAPQP